MVNNQSASRLTSPMGWRAALGLASGLGPIWNIIWLASLPCRGKASARAVKRWTISFGTSDLDYSNRLKGRGRLTDGLQWSVFVIQITSTLL